MALSKTHALVAAIAMLRTYRKVDLDLITYALIPDAIRCFGLARPYTHFEIHPDTGAASGIVFPDIEGLKTLTKESAQDLEMHKEPDYHQVAIGDTTSIEAFVAMNEGKLPEKEYLGINLHLTQDQIYDAYVRKVIDCSKKYDGKFFFEGEEYDPKTVRTLIAQLEQQEFRLLAKMFEEEAEISANAFIEEQLFPAIRSAFSDFMAETTIKYINLDDDGISVTYDCVCQGIVDEMIEESMKLLKANQIA